MANYEAKFCTNYVWVKDPQQFLRWVETVPGLEAHAKYPSRVDTPYALFCDGGEPDIDDADKEIVLAEVLAKQLCEDQIAILMEVGSEGMRSLNGTAMAINAEGATIQVTLNDIYELAATTFGLTASEATG